MCFAPQRRELFFDIELQSTRPKLARACGNFDFFTSNVLGATTACTFSTAELPKVARTCSNFNIFHQNVLGATTACAFSTSQLPKVARTCGNFNIFHPNVLRATTACTFSTSQLPKWPEHAVILTFFIQMCFAPQRRALFPQLNFQKSSERGVFCTC